MFSTLTIVSNTLDRLLSGPIHSEHISPVWTISTPLDSSLPRLYFNGETYNARRIEEKEDPVFENLPQHKQLNRLISIGEHYLKGRFQILEPTFIAGSIVMLPVYPKYLRSLNSSMNSYNTLRTVGTFETKPNLFFCDLVEFQIIILTYLSYYFKR